MTGANIRHHLALLESNDVIEMISQQREGRGRPVNIYSLSRRVLGDGLDELANAMLDVWLRNTTEAALEAGLRSMAQRLGGTARPKADSLLTQRLSRLVDRLNELHYQSRWEAGMNGPNIILGHCPYAAIIASNPRIVPDGCIPAGAMDGSTGGTDSQVAEKCKRLSLLCLPGHRQPVRCAWMG